MDHEKRSTPNQAANKSKPEGERWSSDSDTVERADRNRPRSSESAPADEGGGITNRPLGEEQRNQDLVPDRGTSREGAHAGHGDNATPSRDSDNKEGRR